MELCATHPPCVRTYLQTLDLVDRRVEALDRQLAEVAERDEWAALVAGLRCRRRIDTLTALARTEPFWAWAGSSLAPQPLSWKFV